MNNKMIKGILRLQILLWTATLLFSCSDEIWVQHYGAQANVVAGDNLWVTIENTPELSRFAQVLKSYGYDKMLEQTQAYTVFAPDNATMEAIDTSNIDVKKELIGNHIARYILPASGHDTVAVATLNGKRINREYKAGKYYYGDAAFSNAVKSIVASNGIVHVLGGYAKFSPNIWEFMAKRSDLDSVRNYLYSFDNLLFIPQWSVPGSINENGQQTYVDSVFINYNTKLATLRGYVNVEDSAYTMLLPNNSAWIKAYDNIKDYFVYYGPKAQADSMQRANTTAALVQDLIFNARIQKSPNDSMVSTINHKFYNPQYLFAGADEVKTSNGSVFITNDLKIDALGSWFVPIKVEAEQTSGYEISGCTPYPERVSIINSGVSGGRYLRLSPSTTSANPSVAFGIPKTLSSTYDISCVFVSPKVFNPNATGLKNCKVYFKLIYKNSLGESTTVTYPPTGTILIDPNKNDTVMAFPDIKFPVANYGEKVNTVKLQVISNVLRSETTIYSRELLIDCIVLKPKKQQ
ncbi:MAG TPA: fasciclin domain-containing protein [Paludibacter sp.]|nr:fasciclin domain-containing protein [Paludibacter sp.]